ncbi:MAG: thermonuclease family protein [Lentisphaeria bacterium]|nr:thermonuclease family protein [Lentisphaeria bacterium]
MKQITLLLLSYSLFACGYFYSEKVTRVIDGDTFVVNSNGKEVTIRLYGIHAPKYKHTLAAKAKKKLSELILGKKVLCMGSGVYKKGVVVCNVSMGKNDIGLSMIESGFAWYSIKYKAKNYIKAQGLAKKERKGLWKDMVPASL